MINVMGRRFPLSKLLLYPALVQGENAYKTLISGIEYFNQTKSADVIIIGRGGGSMEDLWAFNNVELAYAIAKSSIPVISAVGHESDFTICDFVADLRAPTPSAAAELAVPDALTVRNEINQVISDVEKKLIMQIYQCRKQIEFLSSSRVLSSKEALLDEYKMKINLLSDKLDSNISNIMKDKGYSFSVLCAKLQAISPLNTLARGYSMVQDSQGKVVSSVDNIKKDDIINISLADGNAQAIVQETNKLGG